ncbi:hypothetical protein AMYX_13650 [Anaeromyxobacter diazotrophicus]|uniref:Uncharacterized protein n=2 Tax=Anaeromyxobacter diazotrophicus TaxID=2590199 RepID=A0A7I9VJN9_9BACT|nr:hypothetical protein AMYX_13650 [Anaeromyxobacter diazotrophicus]
MSWETITLEREALFAEVWAEAAQGVAARYGISGPALAKICRKLGVPVPPRGYWAQKAAGQTVRQPALPPRRPAEATSYQLTVRRDDYGPDGFTLDARVAIAKARATAIPVADVLESAHPLIKESSALLRKALLKTRTEVLPSKRCLDIVASRAQMPRALRIADAALKALEANGLEVEATEPKPAPPGYLSSYERSRYPPSKTGIHVGDAFFEFTLEEELDTVRPEEPKPSRDAPYEKRWDWVKRHGSPGYERVPSGRLALGLTGGGWLGAARSSWRDGKRKRLEEQLNDFVATVLELGERHRLWRLEREAAERRYAEAQRRAEEEERLRTLEAARVKDLDERLRAWSDAAGIEMLVTEFERVHGSAAAPGWVAWARKRAETLRARAIELTSSEGPAR